MKRTVLWVVLAASLGLNAGFLISAWAARRGETPAPFELPPMASMKSTEPSSLADGEPEPGSAADVEPFAHVQEDGGRGSEASQSRARRVGESETGHAGASTQVPPAAPFDAQSTSESNADVASEGAAAGFGSPLELTSVEAAASTEPELPSARPSAVAAKSVSRRSADEETDPTVGAEVGLESGGARSHDFPPAGPGSRSRAAELRSRRQARPSAFEEQVRGAVRELVDALQLRATQRPEFVRYQVEMVRTLRRGLQTIDPLRRELRVELGRGEPRAERLDQLLQRIARVELQAERRLVELRVRSRSLLDARQKPVYDVFLERRLAPLRDRLRGGAQVVRPRPGDRWTPDRGRGAPSADAEAPRSKEDAGASRSGDPGGQE